MWQLFLEKYNGRSLWMEAMVSDCDLELLTDVADAVGYRAFFGCGVQPDGWIFGVRRIFWAS